MNSQVEPQHTPGPVARTRTSRVFALNASSVGFAICVAVLVLLAIDQVRRATQFRVDDAYITFSFSKNLAAGNGPVFSHGLRVEGYSNFLWMVLVAIRFLFSADGDPLAFARVLTFASLLLCFVLAYLLTRRAAGRFLALVPVGLLVSCSDLFRAAASGLETVPFTTAILFGWYVYLEEPQERRRWSLLAFVPAALLRIDGFVPLLIVLGVELLTSFATRRFSVFRVLRWAAPALVIWAAYFIWRYSYYGLPLPTTYYAKTVVTTGDPDRGFRQGYDFVRDYGALALLPIASVALARGPWRWAVSLALAISLQLAYVINVGGDWMPFNRFFLPVVPLAAVLVGWGSEGIWRMTAWCGWPRRIAARLVLAAALGFACIHMHAASIDSPQERDKLGSAIHEGNHVQNDLLPVTDLMALLVRRPGDRLVTDYAGVFSVFTDAEIIDMWGLCNVDIALHGGTNGINPVYGKECADCYARLDPDYFHVNVPIARDPQAFSNMAEVIGNVFQGRAIDRVISLRKNFAVGRVIHEPSARTLWFLERRRPGRLLQLRRPRAGFLVDYPFEAQADSTRP